MSDSPRNTPRRPNRMNRPHAGQSLDPTLTRRGALAHPGSLLMGFGAIVFFAYVFNIAGLQTNLDGMFSGLDASARSHNNQVATFVIAALPYLGVAIGAVVLFIILSLLGSGAKTMTKKRKLGRRDEVSLHEFIDAAAEHGVSKKVAREAYRQLLPHYHGEMRATLKDRFTSTLSMKPVEVSDLYGNLLRHTDRQRKVGDDGARIDTVLDMLTAVEQSTVRSLTQSKLHQRAEPKVHVRKRPSLANRIKESLLRSVVRPAAPAAATQAARPRRAEERSFIRPARLAKKETDLKPKSEPSNESPAAS